MSPSWARAPTSEKPDVVLNGSDDVVHLPVQRLPGQAEGEAGRRLRGHVDGPGQRVPVDEDVDYHWSAFMAERGLQAVAYVAGFFNTDAPGAERFGDTAEVRVGEVGTERDEARLLLLDIDEVQHSVVQDDVDDRGLALHLGQQVTQREHGKAAVPAQGDGLPAGEGK